MTKVSAPALRVRQAQQTSPSQTASWGPDSCLSLSATTQWKTLVPKSVRKMAVPAMGTQASPGEDPGCTFQDRTINKVKLSIFRKINIFAKLRADHHLPLKNEQVEASSHFPVLALRNQMTRAPGQNRVLCYGRFTWGAQIA